MRKAISAPVITEIGSTDIYAQTYLRDHISQ